jgi:hypothetical protein
MAERLRNSINMRTGAISWRNVTPLEVFGFAFQGVVPNHVVQPLLHEFAAHYWCTNTPVSRAIQMRWLDYVRRGSMIFGTPDGQGGRFDPDLIPISAELRGIEACLQPFAEGIATFAEFDFFPPRRRHRPSVPYLTQICMMLGKMSLQGEAYAKLSDFDLARVVAGMARHTDQAIRRKGDLLCHALAGGGMEDCYLLGYALVKGIYRRVRELYGDALDIEAVISFLIYHVYWDWRIVDLMVSEERPQPAQVMALVASSIEGLFADDFLKRYEAWDQWQMDLAKSGQWERGRHDEMPFHGLSTPDIQAIKRKGARFAVERLMPHGPQTIDRMLAVPPRMLDLCTLFETKVWVQINASNEMGLFIDTDDGVKQVAGMTLLEPRPAQQTEGVLTVYGTFRPAGEFSLLTSLRFGREQMTMFVGGPVRNREDWLSQTNALLALDAQCHDNLSYLCEIIENTIVGTDQDRNQNIIPTTIAAAEQMVMSRYRELVTDLGGTSRNLVEFAGRLPPGEDDAGVRTHFSKGRLFDAYSLLGLGNSFTESPADLEKVFAAQNYNLAELLQYTDQVARDRGVTLVERTGNGGIRAIL